MNIRFVLTMILGFFVTLSNAADIYKYVDENGNIAYTDKKPSNPEEDVKMSKLDIIDSNKMNPKSTWKRTNHKKKQAAAEFEDFFIASPSNGSKTILKDRNLLVMVNLAKDLSSKYRIKFYLDGIARGKVKSSTQLISDLVEGSHTLYAEIINNNTRVVIKTTPEITFNIKIEK